MKRAVIFASSAIASAVALAACFIDTSGLSGGNASTTPDAGASDATPPEPISVSDAAEPPDVVTPTDACIPLVSQADDGSIVPPTGFDLLGTAAVDGNTIALTADEINQAGAMWSSATASFDRFDATIGFSITTAGAKPADGFGFAWVNATGVPGLSQDGDQLAIHGLPGYAVVVDEWGQNYPVTAPLVAVVDLTKDAPASWTLKAAPISAAVTDGKEHFLRVTFDAGVVTVRVDGATLIDHFTIAGYAPYFGRWGLGSGTGGSSAAHRITRVSFLDPSRSCE